MKFLLIHVVIDFHVTSIRLWRWVVHFSVSCIVTALPYKNIYHVGTNFFSFRLSRKRWFLFLETRNIWLNNDIPPPRFSILSMHYRQIEISLAAAKYRESEHLGRVILSLATIGCNWFQLWPLFTYNDADRPLNSVSSLIPTGFFAVPHPHDSKVRGNSQKRRH